MRACGGQVSQHAYSLASFCRRLDREESQSIAWILQDGKTRLKVGGRVVEVSPQHESGRVEVPRRKQVVAKDNLQQGDRRCLDVHSDMCASPHMRWLATCKTFSRIVRDGCANMHASSYLYAALCAWIESSRQIRKPASAWTRRSASR